MLRVARRPEFGGRKAWQQSRKDQRPSTARGEIAPEKGRKENQEVLLKEVRAALHLALPRLLREIAQGIGILLTEL